MKIDINTSWRITICLAYSNICNNVKIWYRKFEKLKDSCRFRIRTIVSNIFLRLVEGGSLEILKL